MQSEALKLDLGQSVVILEVTISDYYSGKKYFEMTYNLPMFGYISKITFFKAKLSIKVVPFCVQGQWLSQNCKQASIENHIFRGKQYCLYLREIQ